MGQHSVVAHGDTEGHEGVHHRQQRKVKRMHGPLPQQPDRQEGSHKRQDDDDEYDGL